MPNQNDRQRGVSFYYWLTMIYTAVMVTVAVLLLIFGG